jgi:hypothetical protein
MYANLCGFRSWNAIVQVIGTQAPTPLDETLSAEDLAVRRSEYIAVLVSVFGMNPHYASHLVASLSPTSERLPRKIAFDSTSMYDSDEDGRIPLIPPGMESMLEEGMDAFLDMLKESNPELRDFDTTNFAERMRISKPINPGVYYDFCQNHGWDLDEESYEEEYVFGEPSFSINSPNGDVLVYANSIVQTPYDKEDEMAEHVRSTVLQNAIEFYDNPRLILFWGQPMSKTVGNFHFTCPGSLYVDGKWHDMLMNAQMRSVDTMIEMVRSGIDFNNPDKIFDDKYSQTAKTFLALTVGAKNSEELSKFKIMTIGSASGWNTPIISGKD